MMQGEQDKLIKLFPALDTDITIEGENTVLILDAKYYGNIIVHNQYKDTYRSGHLQQIHTYVTSELLGCKQPSFLLR